MSRSENSFALGEVRQDLLDDDQPVDPELGLGVGEEDVGHATAADLVEKGVPPEVRGSDEKAGTGADMFGKKRGASLSAARDGYHTRWQRADDPADDTARDARKRRRRNVGQRW